ncbi:MAG: nucleotidyltransferase domain-containing protein [Clostridia bacterium]|nr:nucleotidyltransferase domain-containing protein [Clostridia bacterium]
MTVKQLRIEKDLTQAECAAYLQIPLRTYVRYESNESKINKVKYQYIIDRLNEYGVIDEERGILTVDRIISECRDIFQNYNVEFCYLFGSYAKGNATEKSDVDLLISMPVDGLKYYELAETLRERLKKRVDLLDTNQLVNNPALLNELLKDGIKIYG